MRQPVLVVADDLTGAAEAAAALRPHDPRAPGVPLALWPATGADRHGDLVVDTDTRWTAPATARDRVDAVVRAAHRPGRRLYKKVDSLLRGPIAAELTPLLTVGPLVVAPALPAVGRTCVNGRVEVNGLPPAGLAARSVAEVLAPLPSVVLDLGTVRGDRAALTRALDAAWRAGRVAICDSESDDDLAAVAAAAWGADDTPRVLAGASGLLAAATGPGSTAASVRTARDVLVVVGTAEPTAARQLRLLEHRGARVHLLTGHELRHGGLRPDGNAPIVAIGLRDVVDAEPRAVTAALGQAAVGLADGRDLVLTGGETARAVLDALAVDELTVDGPVRRHDGRIEPGAVRSRTRGHRLVITRPGSFGADDSLAEIVRTLTPRGN